MLILAATFNYLGAVHRVLGDLQQAKEYYDRALAICTKKLGPKNVDVVSTFNNLSDLAQAKEYNILH